MKKILVIFLLTSLISCSKVDTSDQTEFLFYIIQNQDDVDNFKATRIFGDLQIDGEAVHDLSGLSTLTSVGAIVIRNTQLTNLQGLHNLQNLRGKVHLENNPLLEDVTALSNISTQIITLNLIENASLSDLTGLNIAYDADQLHIEAIPIENLEVFTNINHINTLTLFYLPELNSIEGLIGLESIDEQLLLEGLPILFSLEGFNNVHSISTDLKIIDLNISDFHGFNGLVTCKSIEMRDLSHLQSMEGFDSLEYVAESILIKDCTFIEEFNGFPSLNTTQGITINNLYSLTTISGLQDLSVILNDLVIIENNFLTDYCGLETFLMNGGLGGSYEVFNNAYNPTLQDIIDGNCSL
jgi:hypothetical protein